MGPTASGKTDLAIHLVKNFRCEIISVDSALIYQGMDIGTAKPTQEELRDAPHRLIDFLDPVESYSVAEFRRDALKHIQDIQQQDKIPILVGGTMLYHRALLYGLSELPPADKNIRARLDDIIATQGAAFLHQRLAEIDPQAAARIHQNDPQRIQRALEVYELSGKTMTQLQLESAQKGLEYPHAKIIIAPSSRELLRERIAIRFNQMLKNGFVEEVQQLQKRGDLSLQLPSMRSVGYRQVWEYLESNPAQTMTYDEMVENGITITRQFAKRQMTWLRREKDALWLNTDDSQVNKLAEKYLQTIIE